MSKKDKDKEQAERYRGAAEHEGPVLGAFFDWMDEQGIVFAQYVNDKLEQRYSSKERIIADFLGIDLAAVERYRQKILEELRGER